MPDTTVDSGTTRDRPLPAEAAAPATPMERLRTGDAGLDTVLAGGIPRDSLYILSGPPGAGKTILAQQMSFAAAGDGKRVIYFTNVSEPHAKLVQHMRPFAFFQPDLVGGRLLIYNITSQVRDKGLKETLAFIVDTVRAERADLVIVDSFRGLKHVLEVGARDRGAIFDLAAQLSILGCTSILVGEYTPLEIQTDPEFAIADGIISIAHGARSVQEQRSLRVIKMRGTDYLGGEHTVRIDEHGCRVFPRQEALSQAPAYRAIERRISIGIEDLDRSLRGGLIQSSSTLIAGSAGVGKTILSLHFLAAGLRDGEHGLFLSFQENADQLRTRGSQFGLDVSRQADDRLHILALSPVELNLDVAAALVREAVEAHQIQRLVIDSVAELEAAAAAQERFDDFLASLIGFLRQREITTLMTREIAQLFGNDLTITSRGLSYIVDNIVLLRYIELGAQIRRAIAVLKSRGSDHEKTLREFLIHDGRLSIGDTFGDLAGVITGLPQPLFGANARPATPDEG